MLDSNIPTKKIQNLVQIPLLNLIKLTIKLSQLHKCYPLDQIPSFILLFHLLNTEMGEILRIVKQNN